MKIKFLQDFQGVETGGKFYERGQIVLLDDSVAARLVADKRAELIVEDYKETVSIYGAQPEPELRNDEAIYTSKKRGRK